MGFSQSGMEVGVLGGLVNGMDRRLQRTPGLVVLRLFPTTWQDGEIEAAKSPGEPIQGWNRKGWMGSMISLLGSFGKG